ncbi:MAG TPA: bifunctional riboflavin kinase/FAD synthetase [Gammaproteobacteria bacterium]
MEIIRDRSKLEARHGSSAVTIGNFDGVHVGHQAILSELRKQALMRGVPPVVVTFEPTPQEYFAPETAPARLTGFREKYEMLDYHGMARMLVLRFDAGLAALSADRFIREILVDGLGVEYLVIGDDFRFGKGRAGDFALLVAAGGKYGFEVAATPTQTVNGERVSSTRVRQALANGDLALARELLGRMYRMSGKVTRGDRIGRQLGFPTANLRRPYGKLPVNGIFLVRVYGIDGEPLYGVASAGTRPAVNGKRDQVEVYLFDFDRDIYGRHIEIEFLEKLREEEMFPDLDSLREQIRLDVNEGRLRMVEWQKRERTT